MVLHIPTLLLQTPLLSEADFADAMLYRPAEVLFARPADYGDMFTAPVPVTAFQDEAPTEVPCTFGEMTLFSRENGQLVFSDAISRAHYNNCYHETAQQYQGCIRVYELLRITRLKQDRVVELGFKLAPTPRKFLVSAGEYAAMALRADGNHVMMPAPVEPHPKTKRPMVSTRYIACDENGRLLADRSSGFNDPRQERGAR